GAIGLLAAGIVSFLIRLVSHAATNGEGVGATRYVAVGPWTLGAIVLASFLVLWRHRSNIQRLRAGTEPKAGQRIEANTGGTP
ncbi:MAG TPA: hypothetical protein PKH07_12805, partial [bacterium]|nr:hypothetical protein [bacterium]